MEVQRRIDIQRSKTERRPSPAPHDLILDDLDEVRRPIPVTELRRQDRRCGEGLFQRVLFQEIRRVHAPQNVCGTRCGLPPAVTERIQRAGRIGQPGQHGRFRQTQVRGGLSEKRLRRILHAVGIGTEETPVDINLKQSVLGRFTVQPCEHRLQLHGQQHLPRLPQIGLLAGQEQILDDLLGNRASTSDFSEVRQVCQERTCDALQAYTPVVVERLIFGCNDRLDKPGTHLVQPHLPDPAVERKEQLPGIRENIHARLAAQRVGVGRNSGKGRREPDETNAREEEHVGTQKYSCPDPVIPNRGSAHQGCPSLSPNRPPIAPGCTSNLTEPRSGST